MHGYMCLDRMYSFPPLLVPLRPSSLCYATLPLFFSYMNFDYWISMVRVYRMSGLDMYTH